MSRRQYFSSYYGRSQWRFQTISVIYDWLSTKNENENETENDSNLNGTADASFTINPNKMFVEIVVIANSDFAISNDYSNEYFLCVFNDATIILSNKIVQHDNKMFVIQCDISNHTWIKNQILNDSLSNEYMNSPITHVGLTLFALKAMNMKHMKHMKSENYNIMRKQIEIGLRLKLPVCGKIVLNHKPKQYKNEKEYYYDINPSEYDMYTNINISDIDNNKNKPKYFLSGATEVYPYRDSGQQDILVEQYIDYYLFQGFEHFYIYHHIDHIFKQQENKNDIDTSQYFYNLFVKNNYISNGLVTFIEWPLASHERNRKTAKSRVDWVRIQQHTVWMDVTRKFMYDSEFIYFGDADEIIIPIDKKQTIKQKLKYIIENDDEYNKSPDCVNGFHIRTYPAFQNIYKLYHYDTPTYNHNENKFDNDKDLGCNLNNLRNRYDTFLERHSCIYWKTQSISNSGNNINNNGYLNNISSLDQLNDLNQTWFANIKANLGETGCTLLDCSNPVGLFQKMITQGFRNQACVNYTVFTKLIVKPRDIFMTTQHMIEYTRQGIQNPKKQKYCSRLYPPLKCRDRFSTFYKHSVTLYLNFEKYMFAVHARDHWRKVNPTQYEMITNKDTKNIINWTNPCDMRYFWSLIQSKCDKQEYILHWNDLFLQTDIGKTKYKDKLLVDPLIDKDGIFCHLNS